MLLKVQDTRAVTVIIASCRDCCVNNSQHSLLAARSTRLVNSTDDHMDGWLIIINLFIFTGVYISLAVNLVLNVKHYRSLLYVHSCAQIMPFH